MPINRNTLLRYKTIDRMLRNGRRATLEELIYACNDALYEHNGYGEVSKRTVQHDIEEMRYSRELGYYAPIKVVDRKYYHYTDYDYSITDVPLSDTDMRQLTEAVELLKQMSSFQGFDDVEDVVNRASDILYGYNTDEITSKQIGEAVLDVLAEVNEVAYVRFASVYREFKDVSTFMDELGKLLEQENSRSRKS